MSTVSAEHSTDSDFIGDRPQNVSTTRPPYHRAPSTCRHAVRSDSLSPTTSIYGTFINWASGSCIELPFLSFALHLRPAAVVRGLPMGIRMVHVSHGDYDSLNRRGGNAPA